MNRFALALRMHRSVDPVFISKQLGAVVEDAHDHKASLSRDPAVRLAVLAAANRIILGARIPVPAHLVATVEQLSTQPDRPYLVHLVTDIPATLELAVSAPSRAEAVRKAAAEASSTHHSCWIAEEGHPAETGHPLHVALVTDPDGNQVDSDNPALASADPPPTPDG